ncbi:MAG: RHS repeat-associated core domain-containing protein [Saprospiraceae bacterium]|nr:RHS repeat-associated core domain-containing protein [Saprospiraceae bacterium]
MERGGNSATAIDPYDMDELTYNYITGTNQLDYVTDAATGTYSDDISGGQSTGNYTYDLIGNLISDNAEGINNITWNVYGKISSIDKVSGPDLTFAYDPMGNRIMKLVDDGSALIYTYYLRDAQGNVLSTYSRIDDASDDIITLSELHIYGSSRLGIMVEDLDMSTTITSDGHSQRILGKKRYELNNHLGNVLTVISDRRFGTEQGTTGLIKYYEADVLQAQDYYPFGMLTPGRNWSAGSEYRFGFNGKESDAETYGEGNAYDYGFRIYNPRLGRFLSVDPLTPKFPMLTPYQFASNTPIMAIDIDGLEAWIVIKDWTRGDIFHFQQFVQAELERMTAEDIKGQAYDCADFAVHFIVHYAAENGLPLEFTGVNGNAINAQDTRFKDPAQFEKTVNGLTNAESLRNNDMQIIEGTPVAGDMTNSGTHINVIRQEDSDYPTPDGYLPSVSGTLPAVPITKEDRYTYVGPNHDFFRWEELANAPIPSIPDKIEPAKRSKIDISIKEPEINHND